MRPLEGEFKITCENGRLAVSRRISTDRPFGDVIRSNPTSKTERTIASHPSLKPQGFLRQVVRGVLPLSVGIILDPFMGAGSTIAAAEAVGYQSIGIERDPVYFRVAEGASPLLARLEVTSAGSPERRSTGKVPLPRATINPMIARAVDYVETQTADLIDLYLEQANVFSAIVGISGVKGLHAVSPFKKHKHPDVAQQRFPDLSLDGRLNPPPEQALESKGVREHGLSSLITIILAGHCLALPSLTRPRSIKPGRPVVIWRVDVAFLTARRLEV